MIHFTWKPWEQKQRRESRYGVTVVLSGCDFYMNFNLHEADVALSTIWPRLMGNTLVNQIWQQIQKERTYTKDYEHVISIYTLLKQKTRQVTCKQIEKHENLARSIWIILLAIYVKISKCTRFWKRFLEDPKSPFLWRIDLFPLAD